MSRTQRESSRPNPWLEAVDHFVPAELLAAGGDRRTRGRILVATCLLGGLLTMAGVLTTIGFGLATGIAWINLFGGLLILGGAPLLRYTGSFLGTANLLLAIAWLMNTALFVGSDAENLSALYAYPMIPLIATLIAGPGVGIFWMVACCATVVALVHGPIPAFDFPVDLSVRDAEAQLVRDVMLIAVWLTAVGVLYDRVRSAAQRSAEQAKTRAEESEERFAQAFEANPDGLVIADWETRRVLECNDGFLELLGLGREHVLHRIDWAAALGMDEGQRDSVRKALLETGRCGEVEVAHAGRSGPRALRVQAGRVELGGRPCVLATVRDVTERARLEEQLRQAQKMEAVGQLAGAIAHDFNNMLTVISGYAESLAGGLDDERGEMAGEIRRAADRSAELTRQLLAFSRRQVLKPRVIDLNEMLRDLEKLLERLIGEPIAIELALAPDLGAVRADPGQIEQVIVNLAINARDAMPEGGTLRIETRNADAGPVAEPGAGSDPTGWVCLSVDDTGSGMDEATLHRAFEPFFTTKEQGRGTGLGLSTVHGIVSQSGGEIAMRSDPGCGTSVEIRLPRTPEAPRAVADGGEGVASRPSGPASGTILLVEDDAMVRRLASRSLRQAGYEVVEAGDGEEALATFEERAGGFDLVLTDVVMPKRGGIHLAAALRERHPPVRVLFMSGYPNLRENHAAPLSGDEELIQKPFSPTALRERVADVLAGRRAGLR